MIIQEEVEKKVDWDKTDILAEAVHQLVEADLADAGDKYFADIVRAHNSSGKNRIAVVVAKEVDNKTVGKDFHMAQDMAVEAAEDRQVVEQLQAAKMEQQVQQPVELKTSLVWFHGVPGQ